MSFGGSRMFSSPSVQSQSSTNIHIHILQAKLDADTIALIDTARSRNPNAAGFGSCSAFRALSRPDADVIVSA